MPDLKLIGSAFLVASMLGAAAQTSDSVTNAAPLTTRVIEETVPGLPPIARTYLTIGTNKFAFLIPRGYRLDPVSAERVNIVAKDQTSFISVRRLTGTNAPSGPSQKLTATKRFRDLVLAEYSDARIREEFSRSAGGRSGPAFDFEWHLSSAVLSVGRVAFIPTDAGVLEFKLVAPPKYFRAATYKYNNLLLSFSASKDGKLETVCLSNKF